MAISGFAYAIFVVNTFALGSIWVFNTCFLVAFYGLYFGVMTRDLVDVCYSHMASKFGVIHIFTSLCLNVFI